MALKGNFVVFALVKQSAYDTPVQAGAGHGMIVGPGGEGIEGMTDLIPDDNLEGRVYELEGEASGHHADGPWNDIPLVFDSIHRPLAFAMGAAGVPVQVVTIDATNNKIDFTEGSTGAAVATLTAGVYSLDELAAEIETQINAAATDNTYTCDYDSTASQKFSIVRATGSETISIEWTTGPNASASAGATLGFTADDTGGTTYSGDVVVDPGTYRHVLTIGAAIEDLYATLVHGFASQTAREYVGAKADGFTLTMPNSGKWTAALPWICKEENLNTSTGTNKLSTLSGITRPGTRRLALFRQSSLRRNDQTGGALSALSATSSVRQVRSFNIQLTNSLPTDDYTLLYGDTRDNNDRDAKVKVSGSIEYSKTPDDADKILGKARTAQKMDVLVAGPLIDAAATNPGEALTKYALNLYIPSMQFSVDSKIAGAGRIPKTLNYEAQGVESVPTGFPAGYVGPVTIEVINTDSADPLA